MIINLDTEMLGIGRLTIDTLIPLALECGYDSIQFPSWEITTRKSAIESTSKLKDKGLKWGLLPSWGNDPFRECPDAVFNEELELLKRQMEIAEVAGVTGYYNGVWSGSDHWKYDEKFEWSAGRASKIFNAAKEHGIKYGLEFLGPKITQDSFRYPFIRKIKDVVVFISAVSEEIQIVYDAFQWYAAGDTLEDLKLIGGGERIHSVHLNDGFKGRSRDEQMDHDRDLPLYTGIIDSPAMLKVISDMGFNGIVSVEPFDPTMARFKNMPLKDAAQEAIDSVRKVFQKAGV